MTFLLLALLIAIALVTAIVLADSGLRLWSALAGRGARQAGIGDFRDGAARQSKSPARITAGVSYARWAVTAPQLRAAA